MRRKGPFLQKNSAFHSKKAFAFIRGGASEENSHRECLCLSVPPRFGGGLVWLGVKAARGLKRGIRGLNVLPQMLPIHKGQFPFRRGLGAGGTEHLGLLETPKPPQFWHTEAWGSGVGRAGRRSDGSLGGVLQTTEMKPWANSRC